MRLSVLSIMGSNAVICTPHTSIILQVSDVATISTHVEARSSEKSQELIGKTAAATSHGATVQFLCQEQAFAD